jgi:hypothetical protein
MMPTLASVDVPEKLFALVSRYALQSDTVWAMTVQVTILDAVSRSLAYYSFGLRLVFRKLAADEESCPWISCRKNTGYHTTDPTIRTQGAEHGRSWIAMKHGDGSLESSNGQHTVERDAELYPGSGPSW